MLLIANLNLADREGLLIFSSLLIATSVIKNQTREIEKKIYNLRNIILTKEKDFSESQLDFFYLTSPFMIEKKINHLDNHNYIIMEYSKIFLSMSDYMNLDTKYAIQEIEN